MEREARWRSADQRLTCTVHVRGVRGCEVISSIIIVLRSPVCTFDGALGHGACIEFLRLRTSKAHSHTAHPGGRRPVTADGGVRSNRGLGLSPSGVRGNAPRRKFSLFYSFLLTFLLKFHVSINYQLDSPNF